ncbi:platelet-derived growth factor receptor alpha-like isoform X2 [Drosophila elegans]|uniref:platelet-derived growth factor receptor alpha-like isoform X2 n=1 Tax=Drosophila elegans TaxID=30023 RepID=UPI001BC84678|nr:platelet-derived growth factor receptor alpha-like isoform X2 [Drosophila elegans]
MLLTKSLLPLLFYIGIVLSSEVFRSRFEPESDNTPANCDGQNGAPRITPCNSSIILEIKTNFTLECESDEPVIWWTEYDLGQLTTSNTYNKTQDRNTIYGNSLQLIDISTDHVAAYYCIKDSKLRNLTEESKDSEQSMVELVDQAQTSSIYVYVNDPDSKVVGSDTILIAKPYTDLVIPCKPSTPDTELVLKSLDSTWNISSKGQIEGNPKFFENMRYHPRRGFTFRVIKFVSGGIACNDHIFDISYKKDKKSYLNVSVPTNTYFVRESVNGTIKILVNFVGYPVPEFKWFAPSGKIKQKTNKFEVLVTESSITLKVFNAQPEDSGHYILEGNNFFNTVIRVFIVNVTKDLCKNYYQ